MNTTTMTTTRIGLLLIVFAMSGTGPALAQSGPLTTQLSCQAARGIVTANGAAVLKTGLHTYDRYVRDQSACLARQIARPAWVPAADSGQCFIGYICVERERNSNR